MAERGFLTKLFLVLCNAYCDEGTKFTCSKMLVMTGPLGLNKEGSKEKIDEGLVQLKSPQCVPHLSF